MEKFEDTKEEFKSLGIPHGEIHAYHVTEKSRARKILKDNFNLEYENSGDYGIGHYFYELPNTELAHGKCLLCRILPGWEHRDSSDFDIPEGYHSKKVVRGLIGNVIVIENPAQILPCFVMHFK